MTNNTNTYVLKSKETGELVRSERTGEPFVYSSRDTARSAKRILEKAREAVFNIVPA